MKRATIAVAGLFLMAFAPAAWALGKGGSMFAIELTHGTADFADSTNAAEAAPATTGYMSSYSHPEMGVQGQYWYMMSDDYAVTLSAGYGFFSETDEQGSKGLPVGGPDLTASSSSFNFRVGGDRVAKVGERAIMYGGPGIEYWSGKSKYENFNFVGPREYEGESTTRISISARIGAIMVLNEYFGLSTHVGGRFGRASAEEQGAKATWWASSMEAGAGIVYMFGKE
jgi:hypothetical protein